VEQGKVVARFLCCVCDRGRRKGGARISKGLETAPKCGNIQTTRRKERKKNEKESVKKGGGENQSEGKKYLGCGGRPRKLLLVRNWGAISTMKCRKGGTEKKKMGGGEKKTSDKPQIDCQRLVDPPPKKDKNRRSPGGEKGNDSKIYYTSYMNCTWGGGASQNREDEEKKKETEDPGMVGDCRYEVRTRNVRKRKWGGKTLLQKINTQ